MMKLNDLSGLVVGEKVYGVDGSEWTVVQVDLISCYRYCVKNKANVTTTWIAVDGRIGEGYPPTFFVQPVEVIAKQPEPVDWLTVPIDTLVEVRLLDGCWYKKYFAGITDGEPAFWRFGATSLTALNGIEVAHEIRLVKEEVAE